MVISGSSTRAVSTRALHDSFQFLLWVRGPLRRAAVFDPGPARRAKRVNGPGHRARGCSTGQSSPHLVQELLTPGERPRCRRRAGKRAGEILGGTYSGGPVATPARERVNGAMHTRPAVEVPLSTRAGRRRGANLERMMVVQPGRMNVCNARGACQAPAGPRGPVLPLCRGPVRCPARTPQPASRAGVLPVRHSITP
jgi:hypothetical protein